VEQPSTDAASSESHKARRNCITSEPYHPALPLRLERREAGSAPKGWELVKREGPHKAVVQAQAALRDVNRELGLELDEDQDYSTVAGLCIALSGGAIPEPGTRLETEGGLVLEISESSPRRVRTVRFHLPQPPEQVEA
jgi:Mg2+/Co2+ transporter CorB